MSYADNDAFYSEDALFSTYGQRFAWFTEKFDVFPSVLGVNTSSEITIDLVLEKLGNPTYVNGRTSPYIRDISFLSYTTYIYVYDEAAFLYAFDNADNLNLVSVEYYPIEQLLAKDANERTPIDNLNTEYSLYSW